MTTNKSIALTVTLETLSLSSQYFIFLHLFPAAAETQKLCRADILSKLVKNKQLTQLYTNKAITESAGAK